MKTTKLEFVVKIGKKEIVFTSLGAAMEYYYEKLDDGKRGLKVFKREKVEIVTELV